MIFRYLDPGIVADDYHACRGGWHESYLNNCQAGLQKVPQQPVNTYSNLAYLAVGVFVELWLDTYPSFVLAVTMTYLCFGSALYHATSTRWAGMLDVTAIYTVFSAVAVYALAVLVGLGDNWATPAVMFVVAGLTAFLLAQRFRRKMNLVIGIFLGGAYAFQLLHMALTVQWFAWRSLLGSFVLFALAFLAWNMDKAQRFPLPRWGHGVWHLLTAAACGFLFYAVHLTM